MSVQPTPLSDSNYLNLQAKLLSVIDESIIAIDLGGQILFWNTFAEKLYGWTAEEVLGKNITEVLFTPLLLESIQTKIENAKGWTGDLLITRRDGTTRLAFINVSIIHVDQQTIVSIVDISKDNPEHHQLQEANRLLAKASAMLIDAVDYATPLKTLARLAVPQIADWCVVHLLQPDGTIKQAALSPSEMTKQNALFDWLQNHLPNDDLNGLPAVLRTGEARLVTNVDSDLWAAAASINSYMIVPLIARPQTFGAVTFVAAESGRRFDLNALALAENLANHIAIYLDKARLYRDSQQLNSDLDRKVLEQTFELRNVIDKLILSETMIQTLFRISNKLNKVRDVDTIIDVLALEAIEIVNGESGFAGLHTKDGMQVCKYFHEKTPINFEHIWKYGEGIPGWVLKYKIPYGTSFADNDPVIQHNLSINDKVRSVICTPILDSAGEVLAYFNIRNKKDGDNFTIADQELLMALAPSASIAIQNALAYNERLVAEEELKISYDRLRDLAANLESIREEERTRIARELHDQLGHALTAMKFDLAWLNARLEKKDVNLAKKVGSITKQMDTMIKSVRRIATELRPGMLDDLGLAASIEWQASDFEKRTGIVCEVNVPPQNIPLFRAQAVAIFRIMQESLTNIERHASAQHIDIVLDYTSDNVSLIIHDDGRGIQSSEITGSHSLGLLGMRERAIHLGGTFNIHAIPGDGTMVEVTIPIEQSK